MNNKNLTATDPAIPCGLVAKSFFNDTYVMSGPSPSTNVITIAEDNIAWESDRDYKFQNMAVPGQAW